ncbi:54S ribosomal protein L2 mitochondrial, partial [Nowakowskiella sp. JEL0078]
MNIHKFITHQTNRINSNFDFRFLGAVYYQQVRHASKKTGGSTKNNRDSQPKYRGIKIQNGDIANTGNVIVRQVGSNFHESEGVLRCVDFTLIANKCGRVRFWYDLERQRRMVSIDDGTHTPQIVDKLWPTKTEVKKAIVERIDQ